MTMNRYVVSIIVTVFLIALITFLLPNGSTSKYVKSVLSMVLVVVLISPLIKFNIKDFKFDNFFESPNVYVQTDFLDYVLDEKVKSLTKNCDMILNDLGVSGADIKIFYQQKNGVEILIQNVTINLKKSVISSDSSHINIIEKLKKAVSEYLNVGIDNVVIYE